MGQKVIKISDSPYQGVHKVTFTPNSAGIYFVILNDNNKTYFSKIITKELQNNIPIVIQDDTLVLKTTNKVSSSKIKINTFFTLGDELKLTGFSNNRISEINISPV